MRIEPKKYEEEIIAKNPQILFFLAPVGRRTPAARAAGPKAAPLTASRGCRGRQAGDPPRARGARLWLRGAARPRAVPGDAEGAAAAAEAARGEGKTNRGPAGEAPTLARRPTVSAYEARSRRRGGRSARPRTQVVGTGVGAAEAAGRARVKRCYGKGGGPEGRACPGGVAGTPVLGTGAVAAEAAGRTRVRQRAPRVWRWCQG